MADKIEDLERKLEARRDKPGFKDNVRDLEAKIAEMKAKA